MEPSRSVEREALAQAALTRVTVAPVPSTRATPVVKDAVKAFNREIVSIPDYLHYRPQAILEALQLISRVSRDLVTYGGKSPKNLTQPVCHAPRMGSTCTLFPFLTPDCVLATQSQSRAVMQKSQSVLYQSNDAQCLRSSNSRPWSSRTKHTT